MGSSTHTPAAISAMPPMVGYLAPPAIPSLDDCFPCYSFDIGKYLLYSSALSQRARWRSSLVISLGGAGVLSSFTGDNDDIGGFYQKKRKQEFRDISMQGEIQRMALLR